MEKVILPYVEKVRDDNDLPLRQAALCIFDVYAAHRGDELLDLLRKHNIKCVFVPASCTDKLQPLDLNVNGVLKKALKLEFEQFYSEQVSK